MSEEQKEYITNQKETKITRIGIKSYPRYRRIVEAFLYNLKYSVTNGLYEFDSNLEKEKEHLSNILSNGVYFLSRLNLSNPIENNEFFPSSIYINDEIDQLIEQEGSGLNGEFFILELRPFGLELESYIWEYWGHR